MKTQIRFISLALFTLCMLNMNAQKKITLYEEYYQITKEGEIDTSQITQTRTYFFKNNKFYSGCINVNGNVTEVDSYIDQYSSLYKQDDNRPIIEKDENERIIQPKKYQTSNDSIHYYTYNRWGDIIKDELIIQDDDKIKKTVFTYEYYYLPMYSYSTNDIGITSCNNNYTALWIKRTVKQDGIIIESINRKIQKSNTNYFNDWSKRLLKAMGYGPTVREKYN